MSKEQNILKQTILAEIDNIKSSADFCSLLNRILSIKYLEIDSKITLQQLYFFAHNAKDLYTTFTIKKKSGKDRVISAPPRKLKLIQELINEILVAVYTPNTSSCGFIRGKSIKEGAAQHVNQHYVLNIDLKDFFDSFEWSQVRNLFSHAPFNFPSNDKKDNVPSLIAYLCCVPKEVERLVDGQYKKVVRVVLPQGAPTSPMLTNMLCEKMDNRLSGLAVKYGATYTRYADDISFSHSHNIFKDLSSFRTQVRGIIEETPGLHINDAKTRLQGRRYRQEVTGLIVNDKVNVTKRYVNDIRKWLYYWEHYGYQIASTYFTEAYLKDRGHVHPKCPGLERVLGGKLNYLRMIRGAEDKTYCQLSKRYYALTHKNTLVVLDSDKEKSKDISVYELLQTLVDTI
jgi:retron-type reverse transcriptase